MWASPRAAQPAALAGAVLAQQAIDAAERPSLRAALDEMFGGFTLGSLDEPRGVVPLPARLLLLEDAVRQDDLVMLRTRVVAIRAGGSWRLVAGGAAVTVAGTVREADRLRWHAGAELERR